MHGGVGREERCERGRKGWNTEEKMKERRRRRTVEAKVRRIDEGKPRKDRGVPWREVCA